MKLLLSLLLLSVPLSLRAIDLTQPVAVTLTWEAGSTNTAEALYRVYVKTAGQWSVAATTTGTQCVLSLVPAAYSFRVTAFSWWGETEPSNEASVPAPSEGKPVNLRVELGAANKPDKSLTGK